MKPKTEDFMDLLTDNENELQAKNLPGMLADNREFVEIGATLHWLHPKTKRPIGENWSKAPRADFERLASTYRSGNNIGIRLGEPSLTPAGHTQLIDLDIRDESKVDEAHAKLLELCPNAFDLPTVQSGSGGSSRHFYFVSSKPLRSRKLAHSEGFAMVWDAHKGRDVKKYDWEIELLGTGKQAVLPPSIHPDTGLPYKWLKPLETDLLSLGIGPSVATQRLHPSDPEPIQTDDDLIADLLGPVGPRATFSDIRNALKFVGDHDDRDTWLRVGAALHHWDGGGDSGYQLWCEWSEVSSKFDSKDQKRTWKSLGRSRGPCVTIASVFAMAREGGWCPWSADDFEDLPEPFIDLLSDDGDDLDLTGTAEKPKASLRFLKPDQCATAPKRGYIVKGLLAPRDVAAIVGAPGCGKSTVAPLIGYMVAQGKEAFGQRTRQGGVFYVAAEDETGLQMRVTALRQEYGEADGFNVVAGVSDLLDNESGQLAALVEAVKAQRPSLVILDTLAMAFPGLEENDAAAMGRVVNVARRLTKWGAAVVLIHHDTKAGDGLPRGHSILNGALDVSIALKRVGKSVTGKLSKNRNGPCDLEIEFEIEGAELGKDEDGEPVTAALCRPTQDPFDDLADNRPRSSKGRAFMDALYSIMDQAQSEFATVADLKMRLVQSQALSRSGEKDTQRKAFNRVKDELAGQGIITWIVPSQDPGTCVKPLVSREDCLGDWSAGQAGHERDKAETSHGD